ncbi:MAG TPA: translation initiation factor IF-3 [Candidatus Marinimicrobia bacterium]|nr:translation initiation factor IF-3 [Candidatus Neomarinimicrobiota bacterium]HIB02356.1 translation initiation factor IF-3 [Candidatus Neomarinimicrobiota bacterium]HIB70117.1 translation initiation factor IF-3 [Candidatus Neomarinimicrobiota bacterium]HIN62935.1 translation initiation factor IF-3 [Candidatus Neomarinimicrobiota bacterium]HIO35623.1 translation initiation factor IF-3 [Candidatus Neomarinimicrobiota bacterium]
MRLIGEAGEQMGIVSFDEAMESARSAGLDLVEVASNAEPPVCKIMDYGKLKYDQKKKDQESKKKQHIIRVKEVRFRPRISDHDLGIKLNRVKKFISEGNKVKITLMYRGREMARQDLGETLIRRIEETLSDVADVEKRGDLEGRRIAIVMAPK